MLAVHHCAAVRRGHTWILVIAVLATLQATQAAPTFIDSGNAHFYRIVLDVFSGRPNPTWIVDRNHPLYTQIAMDLNKASHTESRDALGYRGFTIQMKNPFGQQMTKTVGAGTFSLLELELLQSCPYDIRDPVRDHIIDVIGDLLKASLMKLSPSKTNTTDYVQFDPLNGENNPLDRVAYCKHPKFDPMKWNHPFDRITNNCYNYATQRKTNTFAQPGRGTGMMFNTFTAEDVLAATIRDGLIPLPFFAPQLFPHLCIIALVVWPNEDYHFYRLDDNNMWSHKMGWDPVINIDNIGMKIYNPQFADRGEYTVFVSYLGVHPTIMIR